MVSVVCPMLNEERYIRACIESILSQDYPQENLEFFFVDGGSTDGTVQIVESYSKTYPNIQLLHNPQRFAPHALNIGIRASHGEVVMRIDAHATYPTNYISVLVSQLEELGADNVGAAIHTNPSNSSPEAFAVASVMSSPLGVGNAWFRIGSTIVRKVDTVPFGCFRRDVFDRFGYFDEELIKNQDDEFNARIVRGGGAIYLIPHLFAEYYARPRLAQLRHMYYLYGKYKPIGNRKLGRIITSRQLVPPLFVLGVILGGLTAILLPVLLYPYLGVLLLYLLLLLGTSIRIGCKGQHPAAIPYLLLGFATIHCAYGLGYIIGQLSVLFRKSKHKQA